MCCKQNAEWAGLCTCREHAQFLSELRAHILLGGPKPSQPAAGGLNRHAWANRSGSDIAAHDRLDEATASAVASKEESGVQQQQAQLQQQTAAPAPVNGERLRPPTVATRRKVALLFTTQNKSLSMS